eukprot:3089693-Amphidinium_carterae.5
MKWRVVEDVDACEELMRHDLAKLFSGEHFLGCVMSVSGVVVSVCEVDQDLIVAQCRSTECGMERLSMT